MLKLAPATEQFQHFVSNLQESFWGDLNGRTREAWKKFFEADSERQRDRFAVVDAYERNAEQRRDYHNGYYERDFVTVLGTLRLRIARTRGPVPAGLAGNGARLPDRSRERHRGDGPRASRRGAAARAGARAARCARPARGPGRRAGRRR